MPSRLDKSLCCFSFSSKNERDLTPNLDKPIHNMVNLNLGVESFGGMMNVFIQENTKIPIKVEQIFYMFLDNQSQLTMKVYEGSKLFTVEDILLGEIKLEGIPPAPKGVAKFNVCFDIDAEGTLKVSVVHTIFPELKNEITITSDQRRSTKMLDAKDKLQCYANDIKKTLSDSRFEGKLRALDSKKIMKIMKMANEAIEWLNINPSAEFYEYKRRQKELEVLWNPIITKVHHDVGGPSAPPKVVEPESSSGPAKARFVLDEVD